MARIEKLKFTEVVVPAIPGAVSSAGVYKPLHTHPVASMAADGWSVQFDEMPKLILEMQLDNGVVGLGEFTRDHNKELVCEMARALMGQDIFKLPLQQLPIALYREYDGFECAVWDAFAKCRKMTLVELLGGAVHSKIKVGSWSGFRNPGDIGPVAKEFQKKGYDCIKMKADLSDPVVEWAEEIHRHASGMKIIFDPNQRWRNLGEVKYMLRQLERIGNVMILEDPLPVWMLQDYRTLRGFSSIRIVRHISPPYIYQGQYSNDLINCLQNRSADGFNLDGGLQMFRILDGIARAANLSSWHGSGVDLGILEAKYVHQVHAAVSCIWPSDIFGRMIRRHDLLKNPIRIEDSYAYLPRDGYGLGVQLDREALEEYQTGYWEAA